MKEIIRLMKNPADDHDDDAVCFVYKLNQNTSQHLTCLTAVTPRHKPL